MEQLSFREWILTENDSPKCPKCGANMVRRKGQYGEFWGCSRYSQGCRGTVSIAAPKPESKPESKPEIKSPMAASKPSVIDPNLWIAAFAKIDVEGLKNGEKIAVRAKGSDWEFESLETDAKGVLSTSNIRSSIESFKGDDKQPMRGESPAALAKLLNVTKKVKSPDEDGPQEDRHPREDGDLLYPAKKYKLLPEQKKIDEKFKNIIESGNQSHVMIDALAGSGKAQPLDSLLLTPNGYIRMGDVIVGTKVFGSDGLPHSVVGVFPQGQKEVYEITFTDGSKVQCCGEHLWLTETKRNRDKSRFYKKPLFSHSSVINTEKMLETVNYKNRPNHYIPLVNPLVFEQQKVEIDPYVLGILLGDGSFRTGHISYSTEDQEIINSNISTQLTSRHTGYGCDYRISSGRKLKYNPVIKSIKQYGLWNKKSDEKFIPDCFKYNDIVTRVAVLQGLLDTNSYVKPNSNNIEFYTTSCQLSEDVKFLVESLGGTVSIRHKKTTFLYKNIKKEGKLCYRLNLKIPKEIQPFRLNRKLNNYIPRTKYHPKRAIASIDKIGIKECQCISVDAPDNLYVTNNCTLTHNTTVLKHLAWKYGNMGQKWLYLVFNKKNQVEAKAAFPDWVSVYTTNGFLNQMLKSRANKTRIPQTDYVAGLAGDEDGNSGKIEKIREIVQGGKFTSLMSSWGLLDPDEASRHRSVPMRNQKTIASLFKQIRYHFKEEVIRLTNLAKSFAIDHRKPEAANKVLDDIFDKYDIDSSLSDVKERISKYSPSFSDMVIDIMESITGYNFMEKDYKEEMINAAKWLLHETMPHVSDHMHNRGTRKYRLGSYRDFNDDLWFAATHAEELVWDKFDVVLADEVQDFNEPQKIMLKKLHDAGAKIVAVGDKNQCVIEGTLITMVDNTLKPVEMICKGDQIHAAFGKGRVGSSVVTDVFCREVDRDLISISCLSGNKIVSTPEHTHFAGFRECNLYYTYLMYRKDRGYRIGITRNLRLRLNGERAEKIWLLHACKDEVDARYYEHFYSITYGIPTWVFHNSASRNVSIKYTNNHIEKMFNEVDTKKGALRLSSDLGISLERSHHIPKCNSSQRQRNFVITLCGDCRYQPLHNYNISVVDDKDAQKLKEIGLSVRPAKKGIKGWKVESSHAELGEVYQILDDVRNIMDVEVVEKARFGNKSLPFCQASNVLPGMKIFVSDGINVFEDEVTEVVKVKYSGCVYDLNVNRVHNFIANNIVTHNSLYRFRGADSDSFDNVAKSLEELSHDKNVKTNLTHNMRSRKKILDFANSVTHVNNLKQGKKFADGGEGEVTENEMKFDDAFSILQREMQQGGKLTKSTAFLSRTNEPLAHTALKLLYLGIPFVIVGKDIAGDLTKHIRKIMGFANLSERSPVEDLSAKLEDHINQEKDHHEGDNAKKAYLKELDEVTGALIAAISQFTGASNEGGRSYNRSGKTIDDFSRWLYAKLGGLNIEEKEKDYTSYKEKLEQNAVVLTTAHRSKGLEFHRVFILRYDQFPHPKAKRDADLKQEANGKYVSLTRAMDELHILKLEGQPGYKGESQESE